MEDELKRIEIETARIRLERERLALQGDIEKRKRQFKVADVSQTVMETTLAAGDIATGLAVTATKFVSKVLFGAVVAGALSFAWVAAHHWKGDINLLIWDYGYWLGGGGVVFILICAIAYPLSSGLGLSSTSVVAPRGPSKFERKANLHRQIKYWLIACAVVAVGGLAHSMLPLTIGERFGGVLLMVAVALPFWALGMLIDFLRISLSKSR